MSAEKHIDGTTCMAEFWEQSAKLLQTRVEEDEAIIDNLWDMLPESPPLRPEFKARINALLARLRAAPGAEPERGPRP